MKPKTTLLCGICSLGALVGQAETYHATQGTLDVKDTSLSIYYPFDDADALGTDKSSYTNGALLVKGTAPTMQTDGKFGGCCRFKNDNNLGYFLAETFPASLPTGGNPFTICLWAKTASMLNSNRPMLAYGKVGYGSMLEMALLQTAQSVAATTGVNLQFSQTVNWSSLSGTLPDSGNFGSWHSVVFSYQGGGSYEMYLDGQLVSSGKIKANGSTLNLFLGSTFFALGKSVSGSGQNNNYEGSLDEVAVFSRTFDAADAAAYHAKSVVGVSTAVPGGSTFIADAGATVKIWQAAVVASELSGNGIIDAEQLTVTNRLAGGVTVRGDLTLADKIAIDASAKKSVMGKLTVQGGATVSLSAYPTVYPAYVPVVSADTVEGGSNLVSWSVSNLPNGIKAAFAANAKGIDLVLTADGTTGTVLHAAEGTLDVKDTSLAIYYPFDDADALGTDKSSYANGALTVQGPAPTMQTDGKFGGCCRFKNDNKLGYFLAETFPASLPTGGNPFTICLWAKTASTLSANRPMLAYGTVGYGSMLEMALLQTAQSVAATTGVNLQFSKIVGWSGLSGTLPDSGNFGSWHSVVFSYRGGSSYEMYLDGQLVSSGKIKANGGDLNPYFGSAFFVLGKSVSGSGQNYNYEGSLDEVAVFSRAFDAADAAAYHAKSVGGVSTAAVKPGAVLVADAGATMTVNQYNPQAGAVYGKGTVKADTLAVSGVVGAGVTVDGDLTLGDNVSLEYANDPTVVSGKVTIAGSGKVVGADALPEGTYVLMRADSFSGVENLRSWRRRVGALRHVVKVVGNELVLTVVGGGFFIVIQ